MYITVGSLDKTGDFTYNQSFYVNFEHEHQCATRIPDKGDWGIPDMGDWGIPAMGDWGISDMGD